MVKFLSAMRTNAPNDRNNFDAGPTENKHRKQ